MSFGSTTTSSDVEELERIVTGNIKAISANVASLKKYAAQLGTEKDTAALRERVRALVDRTNITAKDTNVLLKRMGSGGSRAYIHKKLAEDLQKWLVPFSALSKEIAKKERASQPRAGGGGTPGGVAAGGKEDWGGVMAAAGMHVDDEAARAAAAAAEAEAARRRAEFQQVEADRVFQSNQIAEREAGIRDIETAVLDVNEIFQDLAVLVDKRGEYIDSIESNITTTATQTDKGVEELRKASDYQKSARSKMCCLALSIIIAALIIGAMVFFFKK